MFACGEAVSRVPVKLCLDNVRLHSLNCPSLVHKCLSSERHTFYSSNFPSSQSSVCSQAQQQQFSLGPQSCTYSAYSLMGQITHCLLS